MVMIAQRDTEYLLSFILFDDESIQVGLDISRLVLELKILRLSFACGGFRCPGGFRFGLLAGTLKLLAHEFRQLPLDFVRGRRPVKYFIAHGSSRYTLLLP